MDPNDHLDVFLTCPHCAQEKGEENTAVHVVVCPLCPRVELRCASCEQAVWEGPPTAFGDQVMEFVERTSRPADRKELN